MWVNFIKVYNEFLLIYPNKILICHFAHIQRKEIINEKHAPHGMDLNDDRSTVCALETKPVKGKLTHNIALKL